MGISGTISVAAAVLLFAGAQADTKTHTLQDALQICARIQNPSDRLACFEGLAKSADPAAGGDVARGGEQTVSKTPNAAHAPEAPKSASEQRAAKAQTASEQRAAKAQTASEQRAAVKEQRRKAAEDNKPTTYDAVVMRAWQSANGAYYIALTNGEIWKSQARDTGRPVKDQEAVALSPGAVGSWFMQFKTQKRPAIRVSLVE